MIYSNTVTVGEALESVLKDLNLKHGVYEVRINTLWETIMGNAIARHTRELILKGDRLCLTVDSAPLRNELFYARLKIREMLNKELGQEVIKDVFIY